MDIRKKIVSAYEAGNTSIRKVAKRFMVSSGVVTRLLHQKKTMGTLAPKPATGGKLSQLAPHQSEIIALVNQHPDWTLEEYCEQWQEQSGVRLSVSAMCRFLNKQNLSLKKNLRSAQAATESGQQKRVEYWQSIRDVEPSNLVFLDEMGVLLGLMRTMGRSLKGLRAYAIKAFYRGKRVTVMGAMSHNRVLALETLDHSMKGDDFRHFIKMQLVPKLWKGAVVVMDNLPAHKVEGIQEMIESVGARIVYLSPYSRLV